MKLLYTIGGLVLAGVVVILLWSSIEKSNQQNSFSDSEEEFLPFPGLSEATRAYELSPSAIRQRHKEIFMKEIPEYCLDIRGRGGYEPDSGLKNEWVFIVPPGHIQDFKRYIVELGVPEEYVSNSTNGYLIDEVTRDIIGPYRPRNETYQPPDPPAEELVFTIAKSGRGGGGTLAMNFESKELMLYYFDNPNLRDSVFRLAFSETSGKAWVLERWTVD